MTDFEDWEAAEEAGAFDSKQKREEETVLRLNEVPGGTVVPDSTGAGKVEFIPQMRILKRPSTDGKSPSQTPAANSPATTQKSLAEREAEYARARARIMGTDPTVPAAQTAEDSPGKRAEPVRQPRGPPDGRKGFGPSPQ
eukprot:Opistho-2@94392